MRKLIEARQQLIEAARVTIFGYVRGNANDFSRILKAWLLTRDEMVRMKKEQSGDFHVSGATMFKLAGDEDRLEDAIANATSKSNGTFTTVKRYGGWVPGFLNDVVKE